MSAMGATAWSVLGGSNAIQHICPTARAKAPECGAGDPRRAVGLSRPGGISVSALPTAW